MKGEQKKGLSLGYFNLARGLGMFLIILGHTMNLYRMEEKTGIFSGMGSVVGGGIMAAFFMISGFGFFRRSFRKCFLHTEKTFASPVHSCGSRSSGDETGACRCGAAFLLEARRRTGVHLSALD